MADEVTLVLGDEAHVKYRYQDVTISFTPSAQYGGVMATGRSYSPDTEGRVPKHIFYLMREMAKDHFDIVKRDRRRSRRRKPTRKPGKAA